MANNFTKFSFRLETTTEQRDWIKAVHQQTMHPKGPENMPESVYGEAAALMRNDYNPESIKVTDYPSSTQATDTHIYADTSGDIEYTADLVNSVLSHFDLPAIVTFTWASTCDKMRVDEFGGGAVAVSKKGYILDDTNSVAEKLKKALEESLDD